MMQTEFPLIKIKITLQSIHFDMYEFQQLFNNAAIPHQDVLKISSNSFNALRTYSSLTLLSWNTVY